MRYKYYSKYIRHSVDGVEEIKPASQSVYDPHKYGLPELKKFPMPDAAHVKSAIKFFNYVSPKDEKRLAQAIIRRMKEYGVSDVNVGPDNRFGKYYKSDTLQHSTGVWQKHNYTDKIDNGDGTFTYVYPGMDVSKIGSRLNAMGETAGNAVNDFGNKVKNMTGGGYNMSDSPTLKKEEQAHKEALREQKSLDDFKNKPVSEVVKDTDKKTSVDANSTDDKKSGKKGKGGSGKKGSGSKKSGSGKSSGSKAGKASGGKSGKSKSGSGKSGKDATADKKAAKEAKKEQKAQKDYQKELQKMKEENKRKQDEAFQKRKQENEKRWAAEEERAEKMRDTSRQSVSKETLSEILDMLQGSDKEYAKKILEGGRSKVDEYLEWIKESRKNNK